MLEWANLIGGSDYIPSMHPSLLRRAYRARAVLSAQNHHTPKGQTQNMVRLASLPRVHRQTQPEPETHLGPSAVKCGLHPWLWSADILATLSPSVTDWMNENCRRNDEKRRKGKGSKGKQAKIMAVLTPWFQSLALIARACSPWPHTCTFSCFETIVLWKRLGFT